MPSTLVSRHAAPLSNSISDWLARVPLYLAGDVGSEPVSRFCAMRQKLPGLPGIEKIPSGSEARNNCPLPWGGAKIGMAKIGMARLYIASDVPRQRGPTAPLEPPSTKGVPPFKTLPKDVPPCG